MFSILYQRGIYPPETFVQVSKYGLSILVTKDDALKTYINNVLNQTKGLQQHILLFLTHLLIRTITTQNGLRPALCKSWLL